AATVARRRERHVEDPAPATGARGVVRRQTVNAVGAWKPPRLHAREGGRRGRRRLRGIVQPLALGRAERGERGRDRERGVGRAPQRLRRRRSRPLPGGCYSHSIVEGGFDVMSSTTRFTAGTSLTIRDEIVSSRSYGSRAQSAVIASSLVTARITTG